MRDEIKPILHEALMCSLFIDPDEPGLTYEEACAVPEQLGYLAGEIRDAAKGSLDNYIGKRYVPTPHAMIFLTSGFVESPSLLDYDAADFIFSALNYSVRSMGVDAAGIDKATLIEQAHANNIEPLKIKSAILCYVIGNQLKEEAGKVKYSYTSGTQGLPSKQAQNHSQAQPKPLRNKVLPIVRDLVGRRTDGRAKKVEALDALPDTLTRIGYTNFRLWWAQLVGEMRRLDTTHNSVSCIVVAAALVEGALTFAAKHARDQQLGAFKSNNFDGDPKNWRMDRLIDGAAAGGPQAILDGPTKIAAERLHMTRQRIHAGRMLSDHPNGPPDLDPEEARAAKITAEHVARAVLRWFDRVSPA